MLVQQTEHCAAAGPRVKLDVGLGGRRVRGWSASTDTKHLYSPETSRVAGVAGRKR